MKNGIGLIVLAVIMSACAGQQLKSEWTARGYSESDQTLINAQAKEYFRAKFSANQESNAFNSAPRHAFDERMKSIFCACTKKIGDKCRQKPDGLSAEEKSLWVKANAVDMTAVAQSMGFETNAMSKIDPVECQ